NDRRNVGRLTVRLEMGGGGRAARVVMRLPLFLAVMALLLTFFACNGGSSKPTTARAASSGQPIPVGVTTADNRDAPVYLSGARDGRSTRRSGARRSGGD